MMTITQLGAAAALVGLAGCAGTPIYTVHYDASYFPGETRAQGPDITVLVRGNPSPLPKAEFDRAVIDAMQGWSFWPDRFTIEGNPNAAYRVVMIFNPPPTVGGYVLCTRPAIPDELVSRGAVSPRVPVAAALCRGDEYMSLTEGTISAAGGPLAGDFRTGIGLMTASLFPAQNPQRTGNPACLRC
jgi:hypothetical protein